jgi:hypothetical protein
MGDEHRRAPVWLCCDVDAMLLRRSLSRANIALRFCRVWDFCNARQIFCAGHIAERIFCSDVTNLQQAYLQQGHMGASA